MCSRSFETRSLPSSLAATSQLVPVRSETGRGELGPFYVAYPVSSIELFAGDPPATTVLQLRQPPRHPLRLIPSGGFCQAKFAADRFFNLFAGAAVIVRQIVGGFAGLETSSDDVRAHAGTSNDGFAE